MSSRHNFVILWPGPLTLLIDKDKRDYNPSLIEIQSVKRMHAQVSSEPAVLNRNSLIHREVKTADGKSLGYIAAEDEEFIYILSSRFREYRVPKSQIMEFNGSIVLIGSKRKEVKYNIDGLSPLCSSPDLPSAALQ